MRKSAIVALAPPCLVSLGMILVACSDNDAILTHSLVSKRARVATLASGLNVECIAGVIVSTDSEAPGVADPDADGDDVTSFASGGNGGRSAANLFSLRGGDALTAAGVRAPFAADLTRLKALLEDALLELIAGLTSDGNTVSISGRAITDASTIARIELGESRGTQAITVAFRDGSTVGPTPLGSVVVTDPLGMDLGELYNHADDRLPRASWNYNLVNHSGNIGAHNPTFTRTVLGASIDAVEEILGR